MTDNTTAGSAGTSTTALTGVRRGAFTIYRWLLLAFLAAGVVQIFLAGVGVFNLHGKDLTAKDQTSFAPHQALGFAMGALAVLIFILALIARAGTRSIVLSAVLVLLTNLGQSLFADMGEDSPIFGGLHALDGLVILAIAGVLHSSSRRR